MNIIIKSLKVDLLIIISYIFCFVIFWCDSPIRQLASICPWRYETVRSAIEWADWAHQTYSSFIPCDGLFFIKHIHFFCERNTREKKIHWATITWLIESQTTIITISNMLCILSNGDEKKERQVGTCDQCGLFFSFSLLSSTIIVFRCFGILSIWHMFS